MWTIQHSVRLQCDEAHRELVDITVRTSVTMPTRRNGFLRRLRRARELAVGLGEPQVPLAWSVLRL